MPNFIKKSEMPVSAERLFAWHENPCALERLTPPWNSVKVIRKDMGLKPESEVHLKTYLGPIPVTWVARHSEYTAGKEFCDIQVSGPFAKWVHHHRMIPKNEDQSFLEDEIEYQMYGGLGNGIASRSIEQLFRYRHTLLRHDLEVQNSFPTSPLTVVITGASGLVGFELSAFLRSAGHRVLSLVRRKPKEDEILWDINSGKLVSLEGASDNQHKQKCELVALKSALPAIREAFLRMNIVLLLDGLYANRPVIRMAREFSYGYIIVRKDACLHNLAKDCDG